MAVQLAPGVYAERGSSSDLGTLDDYSLYVGWCTDVKRYADVYPVDTPAGNSGHAALWGTLACASDVIPATSAGEPLPGPETSRGPVNGRNRRAISAHCTTHGGTPGFTTLP